LAYNHNPNYKIDEIDLSDNTSVAATGTNTQVLQPPVGKFYKIKWISYSAPDPAGSSAGTHKLDCSYDAIYDDTKRIFQIVSTTGNSVLIYTGAFVGDSSETPSAAASQLLLITDGLVVTNAHPICFRYTNSTDVAQAANRELYIMVEIHNEVS